MLVVRPLIYSIMVSSRVRCPACRRRCRSLVCRRKYSAAGTMAPGTRLAVRPTRLLRVRGDGDVRDWTQARGRHEAAEQDIATRCGIIGEPALVRGYRAEPPIEGGVAVAAIAHVGAIERSRKSWIIGAMTSSLSSRAKCPVSSRCSSALGRSRRYGLAPTAGKILSFLPQTISVGG